MAFQLTHEEQVERRLRRTRGREYPVLVRVRKAGLLV